VAELYAEAHTMAQIPRHKNVVSVVGIVTTGGPVMLVLQCVILFYLYILFDQLQGSA
jgi:hypothetical protein